MSKGVVMALDGRVNQRHNSRELAHHLQRRGEDVGMAQLDDVEPQRGRTPTPYEEFENLEFKDLSDEQTARILRAVEMIVGNCERRVEDTTSRYRPEPLQGPGGRDEPRRRRHLQGDAGPVERPGVCGRHVGGSQPRGAADALAPAQRRAGAGNRPVQGPERSAVHPGGVRHAADRLRRAGRAGHVSGPAPQGARAPAGHRAGEPPARGREDLRPRRRLLGRVREAAGCVGDLLDDRRPGGADPERGRAAAAAVPPRGGDEVLPAGRGHQQPGCLRAGAGARGCAGRLRPRVPPLQPVDGHAAAGPARPDLSRRPPLAGQDPGRRARPLPG